jgi:hypothetical protein
MNAMAKSKFTLYVNMGFTYLEKIRINVIFLCSHPIPSDMMVCYVSMMTHNRVSDLSHVAPCPSLEWSYMFYGTLAIMHARHTRDNNENFDIIKQSFSY